MYSCKQVKWLCPCRIGTLLLLGAALLAAPRLWAQPVIYSITPATAPVGALVTLQGSGFNLLASGNAVYFGPVRATVTSASATVLTVQVPTGATHQPITLTANNYTASSVYPFNVVSGTTLTDSSFSVKIDFATAGSYPSGLARADFDGDGKADMVVTNYSSATVAVLQNKSVPGTVAFGAAATYATGPHPDVAVIGDVNSDGKPDLAVPSVDDHLVSLFINTSSSGSISFAPRVDVATGVNTGSRGLALLDVDGDGRTDLFVADNNKFYDWSNGGNTSYGTVSVHRNTGTGAVVSFAPPVAYRTADYPRRVAAGDLDGDGKADLVVASQVSHGLYVFKNTSTPGTIQLAAPLNFATGTNTESVALGDLDGDGKLDAVVSNLTSSNIAVLRNTSSGGGISFASRQDLPGSSPLGVAIGDVDGDSKPDVVVANFRSSKSVAVRKNTSSGGTISFGPAFDYNAGNGPVEVCIGDVDGDGYPDLTLSVANDNTATVLRMAAPPPKVDLGKDTTLCAGDSLLLNAFIPGASYEWSSGTTNSSLLVKSTGTYWVKVTTGGATVSDTIAVHFTPLPAFDLGGDETVCATERRVLRAGVAGAAYLWQDGSRLDSMVVTQPGMYCCRCRKVAALPVIP